MKCAGTPATILVATDLTNSAPLILHAAAHARNSGARILLVYVMSSDSAVRRSLREEPRIVELGRCRDIHEKLNQLAAQLEDQGIECEPIVLSGDPAVQIASAARANSVCRLIIGAQQPPGTAGSFAGCSVAERLGAQLEIPIVVLGPKVVSAPTKDRRNRRILLPLCLQHCRSAYVEFASKLACETISRLELLHVINTAGMSVREREQAFIRARIQLAAVAATELNPRFPIRVNVREGAIVQRILEQSLVPRCDFIVMGASSFSSVQAQNGIVHQVIAEARSPVIILKSDVHEAADASLEMRLARTGT